MASVILSVQAQIVQKLKRIVPAAQKRQAMLLLVREPIAALILTQVTLMKLFASSPALHQVNKTGIVQRKTVIIN